jgi:hypothetical protein
MRKDNHTPIHNCLSEIGPVTRPLEGRNFVVRNVDVLHWILSFCGRIMLMYCDLNWDILYHIQPPPLAVVNITEDALFTQNNSFRNQPEFSSKIFTFFDL